VYESVQEIQKLESTPARNFTEVDDKQIAITPDVYVIKDGDKFVVDGQRQGPPAPLHQRELAQKLLKDPKAKEFISEKLRARSGSSARSSSAAARSSG
jgi:RNA polymerase sigma-54 factor